MRRTTPALPVEPAEPLSLALKGRQRSEGLNPGCETSKKRAVNRLIHGSLFIFGYKLTLYSSQFSDQPSTLTLAA